MSSSSPPYDATRSVSQGDRHQCPHCKTWGEDWRYHGYDDAPDHIYLCGTDLPSGEPSEGCDVIAALRAKIP